MALLFFLSISSRGQDLKTLLRNAATTTDSSDLYFSRAKKLIFTPEDQAEFDFAKNTYHAKSGSLDSAVHFADRAFPFFQLKEDLTKQVYLLHNLGIAYRKAGQYEEAIQRLYQAVPLTEKLREPSWQGWILQGISLNYHDFGRYEKGVYYGKKAVSVLEKNIENDPMSVAIAFNTIAINYDDWGKLDSALFFHLKVSSLKSKLDSLELGFSYNNIGNTLIKLNRLEEAKKWIEKAIVVGEIKQNQGIDESYDLSANYTNLGQILSKQGMVSEAKIALSKGQLYAEKSQSLEKLRDSYQAFYEFAKTNGKPDSALVYLELLSTVEDSIFSLQNAKTISDAEAKYELAEKERILTEQQLEAQKSKFGMVILGSLLILGSVLGYQFWKQQKLKSLQQEKELELQKVLAKVETQHQLQEQRLKISRDLHDNIGAQLTLVTLGMDRLKHSFPHHATPIQKEIERLKSFTKTTSQELRDTVWAMNQPELSFQEIQKRFLARIESATISEEQELIFDMEPDLEGVTLTSFQGISIYRMLQEGFNNALKHAQASKIKATLKKREDGALSIQIEDDGLGFDLSLHAAKGNGLNNLRTRVTELNGSLSITSTIGKGTQLHLTIPLIAS